MEQPKLPDVVGGHRLIEHLLEGRGRPRGLLRRELIASPGPIRIRISHFDLRISRLRDAAWSLALAIGRQVSHNSRHLVVRNSLIALMSFTFIQINFCFSIKCPYLES